MKLGQYDEAVDAYYAVYQQNATESSCRQLAYAYEKNGAAAAAVKLSRACDGLRAGK